MYYWWGANVFMASGGGWRVERKLVNLRHLVYMISVARAVGVCSSESTGRGEDRWHDKGRSGEVCVARAKRLVWESGIFVMVSVRYCRF